MRRKQTMKKTILCAILLIATVISILSSVATDGIAQAAGNRIVYQNNVFTKKLYQATKKIGMGSDGAILADDKSSVKKVYQLLAKMQLTKLTDQTADAKADANAAQTMITLYKKNGKKTVFTFQDDTVSKNGRTYLIKKNHPVEKLYQIYIAAGADALALAKYPKMTQYPNEYDSENNYETWYKQRQNRRKAADQIDSSIVDFYKTAAQQFLTGKESDNYVCSPVNIYIAMAMLAETAGGSSRDQILNLLRTADTDTLKKQANNLWTANYRNDGMTVSVLANSLWLNENVGFQQKTVDTLADDYLASIYRGDPGSAQMTRSLQCWLNRQTGGLLEDAVKSVELSPHTIMDLCSAIYFRAQWDLQFSKEDNETKTFHGIDGDIDTEFMNNTNDIGTYYRGSDYGAIQLSFVDGGSMWLVLPDEDKTVSGVLASAQYMDMIDNSYDWEDKKTLIINYSVPKFDVSSDISLKEGLKALGVTDIFDSTTSDFTPLVTNADQLAPFISNAKHAARVQIDEEGCTATAFTELMMDAGGAMPSNEKMEFILDRPFLFVITSDTGHPLFVGTVNQP